jgi:hypothetical protein
MGTLRLVASNAPAPSATAEAKTSSRLVSPRGPDDWLTARFRPISLQALNAKAAMMERLDNKYVIRRPVLEAVADDLAQSFDILEIDGRRSFVYETCYFDDPARSSFHDHRRGRRQRMKVRVRHYVDAALCFVEVKLKDKRGITVKKRMPYDPALYGTLNEAARQHVREAYRALYGRTFDRPLEPVLHMTYRRITLVAREGGERMTIDTALQFFGRAGSPTAIPACGTSSEVFIVETKSAHGRGLADAVLRRHHQHPTNSCSKYCVAASALGEAAPYNRFLPALRKLGALQFGDPMEAHYAS